VPLAGFDGISLNLARHHQGPARGLVRAIEPGSPAARAGVRPGDWLVSVNGSVVEDILAYRRELAQGRVTLVFQREEGLALPVEVEFEEPGVEFAEVLFDGVRECVNRCEFCYIHQMPKGFRRSLYVMDDDFRLSFLYGSFVTLTNLSDADLNRIENEHLSPLYVSVHATDVELRRRMMRHLKPKVQSDQALRLDKIFERLGPAGIDLYTQLVLVPGRNDFDHLKASVEWLAGWPNVLAVAVVPVGLTSHRSHLPNLQAYGASGALEVLAQCDRLRERYLAERGSRFVHPSDEFYILAGRAFPAAEEYEGFPMLENGVGMVRDFESEPLLSLPSEVAPRRVICLTGTLFAPLLEGYAAPLRGVRGLALTIRPVVNRTFGPQVTCAGLLCGADLLPAVTQGEADLVIVPRTLLRHASETLLDDVTVDDLSREWRCPVVAGENSLAGLGRAVLSPVGEPVNG